MTKTWNKIKEIIKKDPRYSIQAYQFVFEALDYNTNMLGNGKTTYGGHQKICFKAIRFYVINRI